ncbi:MAG TPA: SRPBCC family protein [Candidatus Limnocylindrales bacterium]
MRFEVSADIPAPVEEVFDFPGDQANALKLNERAADHVVGFDIVDTAPDGRRTVDVRMQAGKRAWIQTIEQVVRERPSRLVTRGWTWTERRDEPLMVVMNDRRLAEAASATRLTITADYELRKAPLTARIMARLQRGATRLELVNGLHLLIDHFASRGEAER